MPGFRGELGSLGFVLSTSINASLVLTVQALRPRFAPFSQYRIQYSLTGGLPVSSGSVQVAVMVVVVAVLAVGVPGAPSGSSTSVTLMVTVTVSSILVSALSSESSRSLTDTVTLYEVLAS